MSVQVRQILRKPSPRQSKILVCLLTAAISISDFSTPADINIGIFYFICIVLLISTRSTRWVWSFTVVLSLLTLGPLAFGKPAVGESLTWVDLSNRLLTCLAFVVVSIPVHLRVRGVRALERAIAERDRAQQALQESHAGLEVRVRERTRELQAEVVERARAEAKLRESEQAARRLTVDLIRAQDEERRRIARELHDSVGQYLALSKMTLEDWWRKMPIGAREAEQLSEIVQNLDKASSETRTISYLLHPPLLDELGFVSAARGFAEGFSRRTGIHVNFDIPDRMQRLQPGLELVLFRVLQESLTNIMRHAASPRVHIRVAMVEDGHIALIVRDYGRGMPREIVERLNADGSGGGVGLSGMRERVLQLRGKFEIRSDAAGTEVRATLPLASPEPQDVADPIAPRARRASH